MRTDADASRVLAITDQRPDHARAIAGEAQTIAPLEEITIPTDLLRAARLCTEKPKPYGGRRYLQGVYIHRTADKFVRVVGSDGARLLVANVYREHSDRTGPAWLTKGVILPADMLEAQLGILAKSGGKCVISYAEDAPHVELSSAGGEVQFRVQPIRADFPDYAKIMAGWCGSFGESERGDFNPTAFDVKHLRQVSDVATRLGVPTIDAYAAAFKPTGKTAVSAEPAVFTFGRGVALFVQSRPSAGGVSIADRPLLAGAIKASISALKAHETRNRKWASKATGKAKETFVKAADDFKARIASMVARTGDGGVPEALPAPVPPPPPSINEALDESAKVGDEGPTVEQVAEIEKPTPVPPAPVDAPKAVLRQGARKGGQRKSKRGPRSKSGR